MNETTKPLVEVTYPSCKDIVKKPTLVKKIQNGVNLWLQWYGTSKKHDLSRKQFLFPLNIEFKELLEFPEKFEIILLGTLEKWPYGEHNYSWNDNQIILYFISTELHTPDSMSIPLAGLIPLNIMLLDDNLGPIEPEFFHSDKVRIDSIEKFRQSIKF